jgi:hypothetical protein
VGVRRVDAELEFELGRCAGRFGQNTGCPGGRPSAQQIPAGYCHFFFSPERIIAPGTSFLRTSGLRKVPGKGARATSSLPADETILRNPRNHPETNGGYFYGQQSGGKARLEAHMNHSIHSADRSTHLKIVVVALVAGIVVAGLGISARTNADYSQTAHVVKAGKPVALTSSDTMLVR